MSEKLMNKLTKDLQSFNVSTDEERKEFLTNIKGEMSNDVIADRIVRRVMRMIEEKEKNNETQKTKTPQKQDQ